MRKTKLYSEHIQLNAKMVDFGGFNMPIQYTGISTEHLNVRNNVGIFDVSHMGEFYVSGNDALGFLNYVCSNNIHKIKIYKAQYNCLINENGGIIDDLIIYRTNEKDYMLVVNAANIDKDWNWLNQQIKKFNCNIIFEPGRVDSPPISIISAPAFFMLKILLVALLKELNFPPSEKLSGVIFKIPINIGKLSNVNLGIFLTLEILLISIKTFFLIFDGRFLIFLIFIFFLLVLVIISIVSNESDLLPLTGSEIFFLTFSMDVLL